MGKIPAKSAAKESKKGPEKKAKKKVAAKKAKATHGHEGVAAEEIKVPAKKSYDLVIVESPTKAKTIKKYLGKGYQVIACNGHIKDLPKSKLGVDLKHNFEPQIVPISGKKVIIEKIQKYSANANKILLGPDPDREGEAIAFHLAEEINRPKQVARVLFNAVTKPAVVEAINNPTKLDQHKYDSQKTRRVLDRLVGYKISPLLWDKVQRGLSAGRVQSVALRLIVEREEEIQKFISEQWFSIHAVIEKDGKSFEAKYYGDTATEKRDLKTLDDAMAIIRNTQKRSFVVTEVKKREMKQKATPPFTTSKLQQEAATKLGFSAKKTMMLAQRLYEGLEITGQGQIGLITYMRTDSVRTEPQAIEQVREFIKEKFGKDYLPPEGIIYKKKKGAGKVQDAHEAIRPANIILTPQEVKADLEQDEFRLYELIWNKFVASQMIHSTIDQTTVVMECSHHFFRTTGSIVKFAGFRKVYLDAVAEKTSATAQSEDDTVSVNSMILPDLKENEKLLPKEGPSSQEHWTSPPPRYNDASIVKDLEEKGIGRPSTYASIISNIVDKGYVEKIENRYWPTPLGNEVCKMLVLSFPNIMSVDFTANVEGQLDLIEEGDMKWTQVLKDFWGPFEKTLETAKEEMKNLKKTEIPTNIRCQRCKEGQYMIKWGKNGQFLACDRYPECPSTEDFKRLPDGSYEIVPKEFAKDPCPQCHKRLIVKKGKYGKFLACEDYPLCKTTLPYTIDLKCPECKVGKFAEKKSRYGKLFYGCSTYPQCNNAMWDFPIAHSCPQCGYAVMGKKESKRKGTYLSCPKCKATAEWHEENSSLL